LYFYGCYWAIVRCISCRIHWDLGGKAKQSDGAISLDWLKIPDPWMCSVFHIFNSALSIHIYKTEADDEIKEEHTKEIALYIA